jgi:hypothetical protein
MSLHVVKTIKERPSLIIDVTVKLRDGKTVIVPAQMSRLNKIYAQYKLDVSNMDVDTIYKIGGKKTRFVAPSPKECSGVYQVGEISLLATVSFNGDISICDIPKYAIISIGDDGGEEVQRCGVLHDVVGYEVEYRVCLPTDVKHEDVVAMR